MPGQIPTLALLPSLPTRIAAGRPTSGKQVSAAAPAVAVDTHSGRGARGITHEGSEPETLLAGHAALLPRRSSGSEGSPRQL
jgi:hypothetical protein